MLVWCLACYVCFGCDCLCGSCLALVCVVWRVCVVVCLLLSFGVAGLGLGSVLLVGLFVLCLSCFVGLVVFGWFGVLI